MFLAGPLNPTQKRPGVCIRSTANYSLARSPAFDIPGKWCHLLGGKLLMADCKDRLTQSVGELDNPGCQQFKIGTLVSHYAN